MSTIAHIEFNKIHLDSRNPRLSEFGIDESSEEKEILQILWNEMAVNELLYSIVSNGFWDYEPIIVLEHNEYFTALEGNRRLAAIKLIHNTYEIKIPAHIKRKVTPELINQTLKLPCIIVKSREESWKYVGFKHVNGPAKWGSFAKAKYIAEVHNNYNVPLNTIAYQIGDTNKTAQKLYQGLMVLEQAQKAKIFDYNDIQSNRIYFSHLYTGLQRDGIKKFLKIADAEDESKSPVPKEKQKELGQLLEWLYGSKKNNSLSLIKSQNPNLKQLDEVLQSKEATLALQAGEPLSYAHDLSRPSDALFEENLVAAKIALQRARSYLTIGYNGEINLLKISGTVYKLADALYDEMEKISVSKNTKPKKSRLTE